ncbi:hypothetical protein BG000_008580 [Podila horticola]|nr:hypothetical protein BG000_008580 [Podila horticola]
MRKHADAADAADAAGAAGAEISNAAETLETAFNTEQNGKKRKSASADSESQDNAKDSVACPKNPTQDVLQEITGDVPLELAKSFMAAMRCSPHQVVSKHGLRSTFGEIEKGCAHGHERLDDSAGGVAVFGDDFGEAVFGDSSGKSNSVDKIQDPYARNTSEKKDGMDESKSDKVRSRLIGGGLKIYTTPQHIGDN